MATKLIARVIVIRGIKIKKTKVTEKMKFLIAQCKGYFLRGCRNWHIIDYLNGFCAVGVLNKPQKHLPDVEMNTLWIYWVGMNGKGNKIKEIINVDVAVDEAQDLMTCLKVAIKAGEK